MSRTFPSRRVKTKGGAARRVLRGSPVSDQAIGRRRTDATSCSGCRSASTQGCRCHLRQRHQVPASDSRLGDGLYGRQSTNSFGLAARTGPTSAGTTECYRTSTQASPAEPGTPITYRPGIGSAGWGGRMEDGQLANQNEREGPIVALPLSGQAGQPELLA